MSESGILKREDTHPGLLERAHRLGKKKPNQDRPRPIIVCCSSFKDKEYILHNSNKLRGSPYAIAEDFSKATLDIRRQLVQKGKDAKSKLSSIQSFQVKYRRLVIKYLNTRTNRLFTWSFSLRDTEGSSNWFEPPNHINHSSRPGNSEGYQSA